MKRVERPKCLEEWLSQAQLRNTGGEEKINKENSAEERETSGHTITYPKLGSGLYTFIQTETRTCTQTLSNEHSKHLAMLN